MSMIDWLNEWYKNNCNGDWEHCYGIIIQTCDNPGWVIEIELMETDLENVSFNKIQKEISDNEWICCTVENNVFRGSGSIDKFEEILIVFKRWTEENSLS